MSKNETKTDHFVNDDKLRDAYIQAFDNLLISNPFDFQAVKVFEKAKLLFINPNFINTVAQLRKKWNINLQPLDTDEIFNWHPDQILRDSIGQSDTTDENWQLVRQDVRLSCCDPFSLIWEEDYGLIVVALCFSVEFESLKTYWNKLKFIAVRGDTSKADIIIDQRMNRMRKIVGNTLSVAYLAQLLMNSGLLWKIFQKLFKSGYLKVSRCVKNYR